MENTHTHSIGYILLACLSLADGSSIFCGGNRCFGTGAYCCRLSSGRRGCCLKAYLYQLWWFWMLWVVLFFIILAILLIIWRRRRARYRYVVMENSQYPSCGNSVHATSDCAAHLAPPQGYPYGTAAPTAPPVYSPSEKPPAYSN